MDRFTLYKHVPLSNSCQCMNLKNLFRVKTFGPPQLALRKMKELMKRNPFHVETFHQTKSIILAQERGAILSVKVLLHPHNT